jgi:hypothetical protein
MEASDVGQEASEGERKGIASLELDGRESSASTRFSERVTLCAGGGTHESHAHL